MLSRALGALVLLLLLTPDAHASVAPPVRGVVVDSAGAPLPNVRVVIAGANRAASSGPDGSFVIRAVPPGSYHLDASLIGYAPAHIEVTVPVSGPDVEVRIVMTPSPITLQGLVVTGTPSASDPLNVSQSTVQLSGKALERSLGTSVAQTVATQPGIQVRFNGSATAPVIRGLTGERVLVLQNGVRTGDLSSASADHALSLDPLAASSIEVVRGPASLLYGSSALGGVVNVISKDIPNTVPNRLEASLSTQLESVSPGGAATGDATLPLGERMALLVRAGGRRADDLRVGGDAVLANTSLSNLHGDVGLGYVTERITGGVAVGGYGFEYGLPFAPGADEVGIRIDGHREEVKARAAIALTAAALPDVTVDGTAQWYTHDEIEPGGEVGTRFDLRTQTANAIASTSFFNVRGAFGGSALLKQYQASGEEALTPSADTRSFGIFGYQEFPLAGAAEPSAAPKLQVGARFDRYTIESADGGEQFGPGRQRDFNAVSGSVGLNLPIRDRFAAGASVARAFRAPSVEELFSNAFHAATGAFERGEPELSSETNVGVEGLIRAHAAELEGQLSAYYNRIDGYIFPQLDGTVAIDEGGGDTVRVPFARYAQSDATLRGIEGKLDAVVRTNLVLGVIGDIVRGEFTSGEPLPFMPAAHLGGSVRWDNGRVSAGAEVRHAFDQSGDQVSVGELATDAYTLLGLDLGTTLIRGGRVHSVTLRADNLFDVLYREPTSRIKDFAPNPGRNLSLVYRVLF